MLKNQNGKMIWALVLVLMLVSQCFGGALAEHAADCPFDDTKTLSDYQYYNGSEWQSADYNIETLLGGGYAAVVFGNAEFAQHTMGGALIEGDAILPEAGFGDAANIMPSYIQGKATGAAKYNGRSKNTAPLYLGLDNTIEEINYSYYVNGNQMTYNLNVPIYHATAEGGFVDFDQLEQVVNSISNRLAKEPAFLPTVYKYDKEGPREYAVDVQIGSTVNIPSTVKIVNDQGQEEEVSVTVVNLVGDIKEVGRTLINFEQDGKMIVPKLRLNGNQLQATKEEDEAGSSIVFNFPNLTELTWVQENGTSNVDPWIGHIIAPKAHVDIRSGNNAGTVVCKSFYTQSENHVYAYHGPEFSNGSYAIPVKKIVQDTSGNQLTAQDKTFTFKLEALTENAPMPQNTRMTIRGSNVGHFDEIEFDEEDIGKTYTYRITEIGGGQDGYDYDPDRYELAISITQIGNQVIATPTIIKVQEAVWVPTGWWTGYYDYVDEPTETDEIEFVNTNNNQLTSISGQKKWVGDEASYRPDNVILTLYRKMQGDNAEAEKLDAVPTWTKNDNEWTWTFDGLTKQYRDRFDRWTPYKDYIYYVVEEPVSGYSTSYSDGTSAGNGDTITNTFTGTTAQFKVKKTLNTNAAPVSNFYFTLEAENNAPMPKLGDTVVIELPKDGQATGENTFGKIAYSEVGTYNYIIREYNSGVPNFTYDDTYYKVTVKVEEDKGPKGGLKTHVEYTKVTDSEEKKVKPHEVVFENKYSASEVVSVAVTKVWEDNSDASKTRPTSIEVQLCANGTAVSDKKLTLNADNQWAGSFADLDKYDADGKEITYTVAEITTEADGKTDLSWVKDYAPGALAGDMANGFTITNKAITSVSVKKEWVNVAEGTDLPSIEVQLYKDGVKEGPPVTLSTEKGWSYTWNDLDKYVEGTDTEIVYTVDEEEVPENYVQTVSTEGNTVTIVNTKIADGQTHFEVTKAFNGTLTAGQFSFALLDENGVAVKDAQNNDIVVTNKADGKVEFPVLTFDTAGTYKYQIKEIAGNDSNIIYDGETVNVEVTVAPQDGQLVAAVKYDGQDTATFTNTLVAETTVVLEAKKTLNGADYSGAEFAFELKDSNGTKETVRTVEGGKVAFAPLTYTLADLKDAQGNVVSPKTFTYTISEVQGSTAGVTYSTDVYTAEVKVTYDADSKALTADVEYKQDGTRIDGEVPVFANTSIELVEVSVTKNWVGADKDPNGAPSRIRVQLYAGANTVGSPVTLYATDNWTYTWPPQPKYDDKGVEIIYEVDEVELDGYVSKLEDCDRTGGNFNYTITNTYIETSQKLELTIPVSKAIVGGDINTITNAADKTFEFALAQVSDPPGPLPEDNDVKASVTGEGDVTDTFGKIVIPYELLKHHVGVSTGSHEYSWLVSETKGSNKNIIYDDYVYRYWVTVTVDENGVMQFADREVYNLETNEKTTGKITIEKYRPNGNNYGNFQKDYELVDTVVAGVNDRVTFINTYFAPTEVELSAKKTLNGADYSGDEYTFLLKEGETEKDSVSTVSGGVVTFDKLSYTLADMKATEADAEKAEVVANGGYYPSKTFTYTIIEVAGTDANVIYDSTVYTAKVTVTCDASTGTLRSEVDYEKNGTPITGDVPEFANATETVSVSVTKVWNDNNNAAGKRPANIQVQLRRSDAPVNTVELPHQGNWSYTWNDLPKYDINGQECVYRVVEITMDDNYLTLPWVEDYVPGEPVATDKGFTITNTYVAGETDFGFMKLLDGEPSKTAFEFNVDFGADEDNEKNLGSTVTNMTEGDAAGYILVGPLTYGKDDLGKTYTYTISEKPTEGYYCDSTVYTVTVKIADELSNGEMQIDLSCKKNGADLGNEEPLFKNASAITAELPVQKTLITNNVADAAKTYSFTLTAKGATEPEQTISVTVGESQTGDNLVGGNTFKLSFDEPGTYTYTVKEIADNKPGYEYDATEYEVTYKVDFVDGKLQLAAGYPQISPAATNGLLAFTNTYTQQAGSATLHAKKVFTNGDLSATQFTFELLGEDGKAVLDKDGNAITATSDTNGEVIFPALSYDKEGRYKYVIKEKVPEDADKGSILYDTNSVSVTVNVAKEDNQLKAAVEYEDLEAVFTNTQLDATGKVYVKKNFADNKTAAGDYTFTMTPVDNAPALDNNTLTLTFDGTNTEASGEFQLPTYTAPGTYQYTVKESITTKDVNVEYDSTDYTVVVTVARDGNKLVATVSSDDVEITEQLPIVFTNKVLTTSLSGTKVWANDEVADRPVKITIRLLADGEPTDKYVELAPTETEWSFTDLPVNDENGRPIAYSVAEDAVPGYDTTISGTTITNTKISDGEAVIKAKKTLNNAVPAEGQFTFQLLDANRDVVVEKPNDASGIVTFDNLTYTEAKDYTYTIVEVMPKGATAENNYTVNGMTYDPTEHTVTVEVKQEGTALVATVTYNGTSTEPPVFTNTYEAKEAELTLSLSKTLINGAELPEGRSETFIFVLADETGAMQDEVELSFTKANGEPQTATFEKLTFDAEGTYKYTISEKASEKEDIISDTTKYVLEVKVDDVDGQLVATQTLTKQTGAENATSAEAIVFTNTYVEEDKFGELTLTATKAMSGREFQTGDSFTFTVAGSDGAPMPANTEVTITPTSDNEAAVNFGKINFTEADAGKEYTYTIQETEPAEADKLPGVTYDTTEYTVKVKVTEGEDALVVTPTYANGEGVTITNTYANEFIEIAVTKIWVETDPVQQEQRPDSVDVRLYADGEPTDQVLTLSAANLWTAKFTDLQKYVTGTDTPIAYTVKEITEGATWTANYITGEAEGSMANGFTITNTNKHVATTQVDVTKVWVEANDEQQALRPDSVDVQLYADGVAVTGKVLTLTATDGWMGGFANLQKYVTGTATPIVYTVKEVTEGADWLTSYTPGAPAGNMADGYTITNTSKHVATTEIAVTKVWVEANDEQQTLRPDSVDVQLYADGVAVTDEVLTLNEGNQWTGKFTDLVKYQSDNTTPIAYTVKEITEGESWTEHYTPGAPAGNMADGYTITNTSKHVAKTEIAVTKVWVEANDEQQTLRPDSVDVQLYADGVAVTDEVLTLNEGNQWTGKFTDLVKYQSDNVTPIAYTVKEVTEGASWLAYYTPGAPVGDMANGFTITNTNTYDANGKLLLTGTKVVTGDSTVAEHTFTFGVFDASGTEVANGTNDASGNIAFGEIAYTLDQVGTHEYTVKETTTAVAAEVSDKYIVELDETEYTILVSVVNNTATGNLDVTWEIKESEATKLTFTNDFQLRKGNIGVVKVDSKDTTKGLAGAEFTVYTDAACTTILVLDGEEAIITTGETGAGVLDDLPIGTYWVKETKAPQHYLLDDETVYEVTVMEGDRAMVNEANGAHVTNRKMAKLALEKSDRLNPDKKLPDAEYTLFTEEECENILELPDGTPAIITTGEDGVGELEGVPAGTYWVKETKAPEGYEVDPEPYKVVVPEEDDPQNPVFVQVSDFPLRGALSLSKTVVASSEVADTFLFDIELTLETGDPIVGSYKATLNGAETDDVTFAATETGAKATVELKDGETLTIIGLRSGVSYTVTEQLSSRYDVTVNGAEATAATGTITDNGHSIVKYQNTLKETGFTVEKVWLGEDAGEIKLTLYANGVAMDPQPEVTRDGNTYSYENLVMKDENGEEIVYTVKETAMAGYTTTYQNAAPNADKSDAAYNGGKIINQAMTTFAVKKEWSGLAQGEKVPAIQLTLYCNGKVYTAATPTPDKDGWYTYADLPAYVDGEVAVYTVKEQPVTGFTTTYINKGENAAVTDCAYNGSTIVNSKIPQTGDNTPLTLWMLTTLLAACGLMGVMATLRKREN